MNRSVLASILLLVPESGLVRGILDVLQSGGLPTSAYSLGQVLGSIILVIATRALVSGVGWMNRRYPVNVQQTVINQAPPAKPELPSVADPTLSIPISEPETVA